MFETFTDGTYVSEQGSTHGLRRIDRRFWLAYEHSKIVGKKDCVFGVMDDFGTLTETDGTQYNHNCLIDILFTSYAT